MEGIDVLRDFRFGHELLAIASNLATTAENSPAGVRYKPSLASMVISAFAMEALANEAGEKLIKEWAEFESVKPKAKIILCSKALHIEPDFSAEPWQTVSEALKFRNIVVHKKPEVVKVRIEGDSINNQLTVPAWPITRFERKLTPENAKRFSEAASKLKGIWYAASVHLNKELEFYDTLTKRRTDS
jgi:hypothetical protein